MPSDLSAERELAVDIMRDVKIFIEMQLDNESQQLFDLLLGGMSKERTEMLIVGLLGYAQMLTLWTAHESDDSPEAILEAVCDEVVEMVMRGLGES